MTETRTRSGGYAEPVLAGTYAAAVAVAPGWWKAALAAPALAAIFSWWTLERAGRWVPVFLAAALLLPPLPLPLGDSGPHPAMLVAALGLLAGAQRLAQWRAPLTAENVLLAAYPLVMTASVAFALFYSGPVIALASLARVALFGVAVYLFFYVAYLPGGGDETSTGAARLLFWMALIAALFACLDFYYQFPAPAGFGDQFIWLDSGVYRRAQGLFYEASTLGNFCVFFLVMVGLGLLRHPGGPRIPRTALAAGGALLLLTLMLSYSRASVVSLLVAGATLLWVTRGRRRVASLALGGLLLAGGAGLVMWRLSPELLGAYQIRLGASIEHLFSATGATLSGRLESWRALAGFLMEHPGHLLFGVGYKTLPYSNFTGHAVVADNAYLSALAETGVLGFTALLLFCGAVLRLGWRAMRSGEERAEFYGTWIFCFWIGEMVQMLSGDLLTYWRVLPVYFWVLAMAVRHTRRAVE